MRPSYDGQIRALQGGLSRNKVAVEESAAGSPPTDRDQAVAPDPPFVCRLQQPAMARQGSRDLSEADTPHGVSGATPDGSVPDAPRRGKRAWEGSMHTLQPQVCR